MPWQVIVLEKGRFTPAADLSLRERESGKEMYEMGTLLTTIDAGGRSLLQPRLQQSFCLLNAIECR